MRAFNKVKAAVANVIFCTYPYSKKCFVIDPVANEKYAMGAMLVQEYMAWKKSSAPPFLRNTTMPNSNTSLESKNGCPHTKLADFITLFMVAKPDFL